MLIVTMRKGDYVVIGEDITVHYDDSNGRQLSIGINAPKSVPVLRGKLYEEAVIKQAEEGVEGAGKLVKQLDRVTEILDRRDEVRQAKRLKKRLAANE